VVEAVEAEAMDAEPGEPRAAPSTAAPGADTNMADTNVPDTNVPDTNVPDAGMAGAADARRSAGRSNRQRERGADCKRDHRFTKHCFPPARMPPGHSQLQAGRSHPDPHERRLGFLNTASPRALRCLRSTFRERYRVQSNRRAARALINKHSSKKTNIHKSAKLAQL
jgi:hypothetical protein